MSDTLWNQLPAARMSGDCSPTHSHNSQNQLFKFRELRIWVPSGQHIEQRSSLLSLSAMVAEHMQERSSALFTSVFFISVWIRLVCAQAHWTFSHIILSSKCHWRKMEYLFTRSFVAHVFFTAAAFQEMTCSNSRRKSFFRCSALWSLSKFSNTWIIAVHENCDSLQGNESAARCIQMETMQCNTARPLRSPFFG